MLRVSFPSWARWSFPCAHARKQAIVGAASALAILGGCGGSSDADAQVVRGRGFTFEAPAAWELVRTPRAIGAQGGDVDLVQVTRLPLARAYSDALFERVRPELDRAAAALTAETGGKLESRRTIEVL